MFWKIYLYRFSFISLFLILKTYIALETKYVSSAIATFLLFGMLENKISPLNANLLDFLCLLFLCFIFPFSISDISKYFILEISISEILELSYLGLISSIRLPNGTKPDFGAL
ncbi:hypothetical protein NW065_04205 [Mycoplasmopsis cynos]|nr:hypothetical protein [Mycoplasmopsis cynos]UWV81166.1 hypothetical protein NW065_04205 [Mycoplasmopsis cynos]WAM07388.1 hypothetical protein ONA21_04300 [Mycoplasmopsis cynos]